MGRLPESGKLWRRSEGSDRLGDLTFKISSMSFKARRSRAARGFYTNCIQFGGFLH